MRITFLPLYMRHDYCLDYGPDTSQTWGGEGVADLPGGGLKRRIRTIPGTGQRARCTS